MATKMLCLTANKITSPQVGVQSLAISADT
jgi:hypothetical protein